MRIIKEVVQNRYIIYSYNADPEGTVYITNDPTLSPYDARNAYRFNCSDKKIKEIVRQINQTRRGKWISEKVY